VARIAITATAIGSILFGLYLAHTNFGVVVGRCANRDTAEPIAAGDFSQFRHGSYRDETRTSRRTLIARASNSAKPMPIAGGAGRSEALLAEHAAGQP